MKHSIIAFLRIVSLLLGGANAFAGTALAAEADPLEPYNVVWTSPSEDQNGSMPIGNGDIGANVWVEPDGELVLLLSKTDAWSENCRLLKLGRVRVTLSPNPFTPDTSFKQTLQLRQGEISITAGEDEKAVDLRIRVDAHQPVIHLEAESASPVDMQVQLEVWRTKKRKFKRAEITSAWDGGDGKTPLYIYPDTVLEGQKDRIVWYHRNSASIWQQNLKHQGMERFISQSNDPLLHRTFGGQITGSGLVSSDSKTLQSKKPQKQFTLSIHPLCQQTDTVDEWMEALEKSAAHDHGGNRHEDRKRHHEWWDQFWNRSWIRASGTADAEAVTRAYILQRWVSACSGRGAHPIKFNGSIFTVDGPRGIDADFRMWGGPYWWQNTRLPYWPMLASGDFDMMQPLFRTFQEMQPLAEARTRIWHGHGGSFIGEIVYFWGMYSNRDYGYIGGSGIGKRTEEMPVGEMANPFIRREYTASPELIAMMLDYYDYTGARQFLKDTLLPVSDSLLEFWDQHYGLDANGHMKMYPAQALETLQDAENPAPDIAGLRWILPRLLALPAEQTGAKRQAFWKALLEKVPPLPMKGEAGKEVLLGAKKQFEKPRNSENPELYAIFPFRIFGVGKPELEIARRTFENRRIKGHHGWRQDDIQAAFLGLTDTAVDYLVKRATSKRPSPDKMRNGTPIPKNRFPAFWGPNFDWIPDQCHGGVLMMALQTMILQADADQIHLLPAWPKEWDLDFKLHAPQQTTVEGRVRNGTIIDLVVTPESRRQQVLRTNEIR